MTAAAGPDPDLDDSVARAQAGDRLLAEFADVFPDKLPAGAPPSRGGIEHRIELVDGAAPPCRPTFRQTNRELEELKKQLAELVEQGFIRPSESAYGAPILFVKKKDGGLRLCVDYRALNDITVKNKYMLPRMDELFDRVHGAKFFSKIDLRTGFHQIKVAEQDIHKTAFRTRYGHFEYLVLPMGLTNAPATFQHLMNHTFRDFLDDFVLVFLDDILIFSRTMEDHERHVRLVLERLRREKLFAKQSKCEFFRAEVEFLGHRIGRDGLRVCDDKVQAVADWPDLRKVGDVRSFLGLAGFYRQFIPGFSRLALPLTELTKDKAPFVWGDAQQQAFAQLKAAMKVAPILLLPDPALPFVVHTDASGFAVGAVLQQDQGRGLQPVAYLSKKMLDAETRYPVHEQELLAIIVALRAWRHHLQGSQPFRVLTDHKSLEYFRTQPMLSGRQARWKDVIAEYDFTIEYVDGKTNVVADAMSRRPDHQQSSKELLLSHIFTHAGALDELCSVVGRPGRLRRNDAAAVAARAANTRSARQVVPPDPTNPPPNRHGAVVTPSQRCTASTKDGRHCGQLTAKGEFCWAHLRRVPEPDGPALPRGAHGLRIKKSSIPGAGFGLFAERPFAAGEMVAQYTGDRVPLPNDSVGGPYALQMRGGAAGWAIDAARVNSGPGRWANDPKDRNNPARRRSANVTLARDTQRGAACLRASQPIAAGDEIFVSYGAAYWRHLVQQQRRIAAGLNAATTVHATLADEIAAACAEDLVYCTDLQRARSASDPIQPRDGYLRHGDRLCLPTSISLRTRVMRECHDAAPSGHLGKDKTIEQVKRHFYWRGMDAQIEAYVTSCDECQRNKPSQQAPMGKLMSLPIPTYPWQQVSLDLITQLPRSRAGNDAIVVFVDKLTGMRHYVATTTTVTAPKLAELFLREVVRLHGVPQSLLSDRDSRFTANFWRAFWGRLGTTLTMSTAYHPQTDGTTERANRTLETMLRSEVNFAQDDWDTHLAVAELAINNARHSSTGHSPFYLNSGREVAMPMDHALAPLSSPPTPAADERLASLKVALDRAQGSIKQAQERQARYADPHRRAVTFNVGDRVLLSTEHLALTGNTPRTAKFASPFIGPFAVKRVVNDNAYELALPPSLKIHPTLNVSRLKAYKDGQADFPDRPPPNARPPPVAQTDNGSPAWEVERILAKRGRGARTRYLVRWVGYPLWEATWEPRSNLDVDDSLLADFEAQAATLESDRSP